VGTLSDCGPLALTAVMGDVRVQMGLTSSGGSAGVSERQRFRQSGASQASIT
jgi:hypothetical protein